MAATARTVPLESFASSSRTEYISNPMGIGAAATARQAQGSTAADLRKVRLERLFVRIATRELLDHLLRILLSTQHERKRSSPENFPPSTDGHENLYLPGTTSIWSF